MSFHVGKNLDGEVSHPTHSFTLYLRTTFHGAWRFGVAWNMAPIVLRFGVAAHVGARHILYGPLASASGDVSSWSARMRIPLYFG